MACMFNCFFTWWILLILAVMIGVKIYLFFTTGVCNSARRIDGKTAIVTGANTGIGKETAMDLAGRGAKVILACRDLDKGEQACKEIIAVTHNKQVEVRKLDLSSLESVRNFAKNILETEERLDILVNNAGAGGLRNVKSSDGLQMLMQVNHFAPFLLTCLLVGLLKKSAPSRIIMVSSLVHKYAKLEIDNLNFEKWFTHTQAYNCSKLANILVANELARKLKDTGVTVNSLHPGAVLSDIWRHWDKTYITVLKPIIRLYFKDCVEGAQTSVYLAVSEEVEGVTGKYFSDCKETKPSKDALDEGLAKKVWERSEELVGLTPEQMDL
ncbi:hypothetical protein L9F63_015258 [Diploptera punctata]|uniref:Retinol dehydrogenase 11 n=1 Tax=Diploptera punctata TaxID=6984 RepID=A0AAD8A714_DIPPU|nr:hypothetical protein L9F63_015258 [Diploptera punctata]